jgi:hypothetical protein
MRSAFQVSGALSISQGSVASWHHLPTLLPRRAWIAPEGRNPIDGPGLSMSRPATRERRTTRRLLAVAVVETPIRRRSVAAAGLDAG